jgi:WD40 repeat protein
MCAVSYSTGAVGMYTEEGDDVSAARPVRSDAPGVYPCVLAWHPSAPTLAIGWTDGTVSVWSGTERRIAGEERATHAGRSVTALAWSPTGHRLVTGDDQGTVSVWTLDAKLRPKPSPGFRCAKPNPGARVSHVVVPDDLEDLTEGAEPDTFVFYYAINEGLSDSGHVCMGVDNAVNDTAVNASEKPTSRKIFDAPCEIHAVLHHDGVGNVITLGTDSTLSIFAPPADANAPSVKTAPWRSISSTKLPTEGDAEVRLFYFPYAQCD